MVAVLKQKFGIVTTLLTILQNISRFVDVPFVAQLTNVCRTGNTSDYVITAG